MQHVQNVSQLVMKATKQKREKMLLRKNMKARKKLKMMEIERTATRTMKCKAFLLIEEHLSIIFQ